MEAHGWRLVRDEPYEEWGIDYGGRMVTFRKGDYAATLQFAAPSQDYGWTYAFDLSWGLGH